MNQVAPPNQNFLTPISKVDLVCKKLQSKHIVRAIIFVGLSRVGKSTKFSHVFNVPLMGQENGLDTKYNLRSELNQVSEFKDGILSATKIPTVIQRTNQLTGEKQVFIDLPGFDEKRKYDDVLCVSHSIRQVFQTVAKCKFVFCTPHDSFTGGHEKLFDSILRFTSIVNFATFSAQQKQQFLDSIVIQITKSSTKFSAEQYASQIRSLTDQVQNQDYRAIENQTDKQTVLQFLTYFGQYKPQKISLFVRATPNVAAPPCDLIEKNIKHRRDFQLKVYRDQFRNNNYKSMIHLPFQNDSKRLKPVQKNLLKTSCDERIASFKKFIDILNGFNKKATNYEDLYEGEISFTEQFQEMSKYNKQFNVYPAKFKQQVYEEQSKLKHVFSQHGMEKSLDFGIRLVKTVFKLLQMLSNTPVYEEEKDVDLYFQKWMDKFRSHIIQILTIFRNSFCKNYRQQQILLEFLFIAIRGCSQLGVIFEITGDNKNQRSSNLKQELKNALKQKEISVYENQFIDYLSNHKDTILQNIDEDQFKIYQEFVTNYKQKSQDYDIIKKFIAAHSNEFSNLYNMILSKGLVFCQKPQDKILALNNQLIQHKNKSKKDYQTILEQQDDDECEEVQYLNPLTQKNNFIFKSILSNIAWCILNLTRNANPQKDVYSSKRIKQLYGKTQNEVKKIYTQQQAEIARHIFIYINDVESTIKTYQKTINTIDEKDYQQRIFWLKGFADFLLSNGRKGQAIELYQKIIQLALLHNLMDQYKETKDKIIELPERYIILQRQYILKNKHSDMNDIVIDSLLQDLKVEIQDSFVRPYQEYLSNQSIKRARKLSQNM